MASENFSLKWNDFEKNISGGLREIRESSEFLDVTLVCEQEQVQAHKLVLSACSTFFRKILSRNPGHNPLIYLRGVSYADITAVLNFMYHGEVNVAQEDLNTFLSIAEDLKVKGLTQNASCHEPQEDEGHCVDKTRVENSEHNVDSIEAKDMDRKRSKRQTEGPVHKKQRDTENTENNIVHIKSEPAFVPTEPTANILSIAEVNYGREPSRAMTKPGDGAFRDDGLDMEDAMDREDGLDGLDGHLDYSSYSDYQEVSYGEGSQMSSDSLSKDVDPIDPTASLSQLAATAEGHPCEMCGKTFVSVSHCKRHILSVHGNMIPVNCEICNRSFKNQDSCNTHMRKFHEVYLNPERRRENQVRSWDQTSN